LLSTGSEVLVGVQSLPESEETVDVGVVEPESRQVVI